MVADTYTRRSAGYNPGAMMSLHGVDAYINSDKVPDMPKQFGPFNLTMISSRGTRIYPPPAPAIELADWFQCRYVSETEVSDADIDGLLGKLTSDGLKWTKCQKLSRRDGANLYSEAY